MNNMTSFINNREYYISLVQEFHHLIGEYYHSLVEIDFDIKYCFEQFDSVCKQIISFNNVDEHIQVLSGIIHNITETISQHDLSTHIDLLTNHSYVFEEKNNADIFGQELLSTLQHNRRYAYDIKFYGNYYTVVTPDKSKTRWTGCISFVFNHPDVDVQFIMDDIIKLMSHVSDSPSIDWLSDNEICVMSYDNLGLTVCVKREQELFTITMNC